MTSEIRTKEYGLEDILIDSWRIFKANFNIILIVGLIIYVPTNIILFSLDTYYDGIEVLKAVSNENSILWVIRILATLAIIFIVEQYINNEQVGVRYSLRNACTCWWSAIWTNLYAGLVVILLCLLLIIPGVIWGIYYSFVIYTIMLRGKKGREALRYSKELVKGQWWRVFGVVLVFLLMEIAVCFLIGFSSGLFLPDTKLFNIITASFKDIISSFFIVTSTVFFLNLDYTKQYSISRQKEDIGSMEFTI